MKAIIGGTGVYGTSYDSRVERVKTKYGEVDLDVINIDGEEIVFLARHGKDHSVPPHLINYRANIMALKEFGVKFIYATAAVGSCNTDFAPGDIVVIKDFVDFTKARPVTFFEGGDEPVRHVDMSDPYCKNLREKFYQYSEELGLNIKGDAVYICTEGPRFETTSEIRMYKNFGDVAGMTSVPEVVLAKELGLCYATVGIVTNWCTGIGGQAGKHDLQEIQDSVNENREKITEVFIRIFKEGLDQESCYCKNSIIQL